MNKELGLLKDKAFYKNMFSIALPIALQNLISSSLNMVDTVMIGRLGETQIAAVGLANQVFFLYILMMFGINSGASIFTAQFWGKKDVLNIRRILGLALIFGGMISFVFACGAFFAPKYILHIFSEDPEVILLGSQYLRIVALSYLLTTVSFAYGFASRNIGQAKLPLMVSAVSLLSNTLLNYLLIFGKFGFPMMGVRGAALATLISRSIEVTLILWLIYREKGVLAGKLHEMMDLSYDFVLKFFKTTAPVILNEGFWSLGMVMYSVAYARIGTNAIAAVQISNTIQQIFMIISMGLANSSAVMIGNQIGAKKEKSAIDYAKKFAILSPIMGIVMGIILILLAPTILTVFNVSSGVHQNAIKILTVMGCSMFIRMFNATLIVGILRSGGDTKFSLFLELSSVWLVGVPLAFLGAFFWKLPVYWVVALVVLEEIVKAMVGVPRVVSKKWVRNVVEQM